jgi:hypothetical protein
LSKVRLAIILMAIVALIIIGLAVFVFTHLSGISLDQGIILIVVAVIGLFLVMGIIIMLLRNINAGIKK